MSKKDEALAEQPAQQDDWKDRLISQYQETILWQAKRITELMKQPAQQEPVAITTGMALAFHRALTDGPINDAEAKEIKIGLEAAFAHLTAPQAQPAQQEPVAVPTTSYEHRKFVLVGRDWYERFAAFHDDCQIGEQLTWQEKTIRQQGYENGWNDAQRYLKEPQSTSPTPAQPSKPLTLGQKQRLWSSVGDKPTLKDRVNAYGTAIEAAHGITKGNT